VAKKSKGITRPVFWIVGPPSGGSYYDCHKIWNQIVAKVRHDLGEPNIQSIECGHNPVDSKYQVATAGDVMRLLRARDIFDDRPRIIRMFGLPSDYLVMTDYLKYVNSTNVLVIEAPIGYYNGKKFVPASASKFYKTINSEGKVFKFNERASSHKNATQWVMGLASDHDRMLAREVASFLVEVKGLNYDTLYAELTKLFDYKPEGDITVDDIKECSIPVFEKSVWELIDKLNRQRFEDAYCHLQEFLEDASLGTISDFRGIAEQTIGALRHNFELLLYAKDSCKSTLSYESFSNAVMGNPDADSFLHKEPIKKIKKDKDEISWVPRYNKGAIYGKVKSDSFRMAFGWPKSRIYGALLCIERMRSKMRADTANIKLVFEAICLHICGRIDERQSLLMGGYSPQEADEVMNAV
jgi:hypothetical protein